MAYPYKTTGQFIGSIETGSYFSDSDTKLFYKTSSRDYWFGFSPFDETEISIFDYNNNQLVWDVVDDVYSFKSNKFSYENEKNEIVEYDFNQFISDSILYKNDKILSPITAHLSEIGVTNGDYILTYNYVRQLAGRPNNPLSIKDISSSRREVKLIPTSQDRARYDAFCFNKFQVKDVSSLLIQSTDKCSYDQIYNKIKIGYQKEISFLQSIFFLPTEGDILTFLKNLYEDLVTYVSLSKENISAGESPGRIERIQGIRTYFHNWLRQNNDGAFDFDEIENKFIEYVSYRVNERFLPYKSQNGEDYKNSKEFVKDFFIKHFYQNIIDPIEESYYNKYTSYLKNVLNFGNNKFFHIITHSRSIENEDVVLLVKLSDPLPSNIKIRDRCWVSNFGMVPYSMQISVKGTVSSNTIHISSPNFGIQSEMVDVKNINKFYTADDLKLETTSQDDSVIINKKITELNVDYKDFSNFVVFSSAQSRLNVFKNKVINWTTLSSSLSTLQSYSSSTYPYYSSEKEDLESQISSVVESFDGYESYLFNNKNFTYNSSTETWNSASYVSYLDDEAEEYDRNNPDSLINNTPDHIVLNSDNDEYLVFLSMMGHYFDNLYLYIKSLPVERESTNQVSGSMSISMLQEILGSFGWNVNDVFGDRSLDDSYLNKSYGGLYDISDVDRMRNIWNRILITLPQLYKTKGTEECVRLLLSCHGIPSDLISVKEFGGIDYSAGSKVSNIQNEKIFLLHWTRTSASMEIPFPHKSKTVEFKFSFDGYSQYNTNEEIPIMSYYPGPYTSGGGFWRMSFIKDRGKYDGHLLFRLHQSGSYSNLSGSSMPYLDLTSSTLPIFNGDIFGVMLRRNYPSDLFTTSSGITEDDLVARYDLYLQRNESGRQIFRSTSSFFVSGSYNRAFSVTGSSSQNFLLVGNERIWKNGEVYGNSFDGALDCIRLWRIPIDDIDFEDHINDIHSYSWNSSSAYFPLYTNLYFASDVNYPIDLSEVSYVTGSKSGSVGVYWFPNASEYYQASSSWGYSGSFYTGSLPSSSTPVISWIPYNDNNFRSGSTVIYYNAIWQNFSSSLASGSSCNYITQSVYPHQYKEFNINQSYAMGKYGPNKLKNNKINKYEQTLDVRLDDKYSSTNPSSTLISSDSNIFGFFIDPQDYRNKDVIRQFGSNGIVNAISDPSYLYSSSYSVLSEMRNRYSYSGNKRVLFNELVTLNKYYFDKSIFEVIKNIAPARSNTLTGVLVESSIVERPKYQHKPIDSSAGESDITSSLAIISDPVTIDRDLYWADFNTSFNTSSVPRYYNSIYYDLLESKNHGGGTDSWELDYIDLTSRGEIVSYKGFEYLLDDYKKILWQESLPPNYGYTVDISYINYPNTIHPVNFGGSYIPALSDDYQFGWFTDMEGSPRNDTVISNGTNPLGAVDRKDESSHRSGSAVYYLMKRWRKYNIYDKSGSYYRDENPKNDLYCTSSTYLYDIIHVNENFYKNIVYMKNNEARESTDPSTVFQGGYGYKHLPSTFVSTSNSRINNLRPTLLSTGIPTDLDYYLEDTDYFEIFSGYPRNHYIHKMQIMSPERIIQSHVTVSGSAFVKGKQTIDTTINKDRLGDNSLPITTLNVSNVNVIATDNILS